MARPAPSPGERSIRAIREPTRAPHRPPSDPIAASLAREAPTGIQIVRGLTGDEPGRITPSLGEVGNVVAALALGGAGRGAVAAARGRSTLSGTQAARRPRSEPRAQRRDPLTPDELARSVATQREATLAQRTVARTTARRATSRGPFRRAFRRGPRGGRGQLSSHPAAVAATLGGPIGGVGGAFVQGHLEADPLRALHTTSRAIPASLAFIGSAIGSGGVTAGRAASTGAAALGIPGARQFTGSEITEPVRGVGGELGGVVEGLKPLVSGDPEQVRQTVEDELGYMFVPLLPRGAVSSPVRGVRSGARAAGRAVREPLARRARIRRAMRGEGPQTQPGPLRQIRQRIGGEGRAARRRIARMAAHETQPERFAAARRQAELNKALRKTAGARSLRNRHGRESGELVGVLADYGISRRNPLDQLRQVRSSIERTPERVPEGFSLPVDAVTTRRVIEWAEQNPHVLRDQNLWRAVDSYKRGAQDVTTSPVAQHRQQARLLEEMEGRPLRPPEERVPMRAREFTDAETRRGAHADLKRMREQTSRLRGEARKAIRDAQVADARAKGTPTGSAQRVRAETQARAARERVARLRSEARQLDERAKGLGRELRRYRHPDTKPSPHLKRKGFGEDLAKEFLDEVQARAREVGLETPGWTRHADLRRVLDGDIPLAGQRPTPAQAQHIRTGAAEIADMVDRSYNAFVRGSIWFPRMQRGVSSFVRRFIESERRPVRIGDQQRTVITRDEWNRGVREGTIDPTELVPLPAQRWQRAIEDPTYDPGRFHTEANAHIKGELKARVDDGPGSRYVAVTHEAAREFLDQINPQGPMIENLLSAFGTVGTRAILGYSSAWAMIQVGAEGLQMLAAVSNPHRLIRGRNAAVKAAQKDPTGYEGFAGAAGESVMSFDTPNVHRINLDAGTMGRYSNAYRAIGSTVVGRAMLEGARGKLMGMFDKWKGGKFRVWVQAADVDRGLNSFLGSLQNATRIQKRVADELKGKPLDEQIAWLGRNRRHLEEHSQYIQDLMGDYTAFTRFERAFGPLAIFMPFIRMSFRWTFNTYPRHHPIKAQMIYFLAQQHADTIEKMVGGTPDWLRYSDPVIHGEDGPIATLPIGHRMMIGLNAVSQAAGRGQLEAMFQGLNPFISTPIFAGLGVDPLSGEQTVGTRDDLSFPQKMMERGLLVMNQMLSMPAPLRLTPASRLGQGERGPISQRFREIDPQRQVRANVFPFIPQSAEQAREWNQLRRVTEQGFGGTQITIPRTEEQRRGRTELERLFPQLRGDDDSEDERESQGGSWRGHGGEGGASWRGGSGGGGSWRR